MEDEERGGVGLQTAADLAAMGDLTVGDLTREDLTADGLVAEGLATEDLGCARPLPFPVLRLTIATVVGVRL